ncbi:hypothetical protein D3C76_1634810 [compost metagenome]
MDHRQVFGIAAGNTVDCAQFTYAKSRQQGGGWFTTRVTVSSIGGIKFIGAPYPGDLRVIDHVIKKLQVIVTRHAKEVPDADLS